MGEQIPNLLNSAIVSFSLDMTELPLLIKVMHFRYELKKTIKARFLSGIFATDLFIGRILQTWENILLKIPSFNVIFSVKAFYLEQEG
jgi:uncharacterized membrane protein